MRQKCEFVRNALVMRRQQNNTRHAFASEMRKVCVYKRNAPGLLCVRYALARLMRQKYVCLRNSTAMRFRQKCVRYAFASEMRQVQVCIRNAPGLCLRRNCVRFANASENCKVCVSNRIAPCMRLRQKCVRNASGMRLCKKCVKKFK